MTSHQANGALTPAELRNLLVHMWRASSVGRYCPILVWGEAGIGKSQTVAQTAKMMNIGFKDLRLGLFEAPDLLGVPRQQAVYPCFLDFENDQGRAQRGRRYTTYGLWNRIRDLYADQVPTDVMASPDKTVKWAIQQAMDRGLGGMFDIRTVNSPPGWLPQPGTAGILFLDEINRSQRDIRQGVFQLLLDRRIGENDLPSRWIIVSAVNPPSAADEQGGGGYEVADFSDKAFISRFCHLALRPSVSEWTGYARGARIDPMIRTFVQQGGLDVLGGGRPTEIPDPEPTPRSWTILSKVVADVPNPDGPPSRLDRNLVALVACGLVGSKAMRLWFAARAIPDPLVTFDDIQRDPKASLERLRAFLDYPRYDPDTGQAVTDEAGQIIRNRRTDIIHTIFEDIQVSLQILKQQKDALKGENEERKKQGLPTIDPLTPEKACAALALIQWGMTPEEQGGIGMRDVAFQAMRQWFLAQLLPVTQLVSPSPAMKETMAQYGVTPAWIIEAMRQINALSGRATKAAGPAKTSP